MGGCQCPWRPRRGRERQRFCLQSPHFKSLSGYPHARLEGAGRPPMQTYRASIHSSSPAPSSRPSPDCLMPPKGATCRVGGSRGNAAVFACVLSGRERGGAGAADAAARGAECERLGEGAERANLGANRHLVQSYHPELQPLCQPPGAAQVGRVGVRRKTVLLQHTRAFVWAAFGRERGEDVLRRARQQTAAAASGGHVRRQRQSTQNTQRAAAEKRTESAPRKRARQRRTVLLASAIASSSF